ncbi:hypothetical protein [Catenulispora rubra]|uniref:hypothetical protein n=1 Tax=Catenulispora rubra TaxID=280293 RepID=UPI001892196A|nr:hypothetical protein [Catenulispora rubra]
MAKALTNLSGQGNVPPDEEEWRRLLTAKRTKRDADGNPVPTRSRRMRIALRTATGVLVMTALGNLVVAMVAPGDSLLSQKFWHTSSSTGSDHAAPSSPAKPAPETLEATAGWCCRVAVVTSSVGYYVPGSAADLTAAVTHRTSLTPAGVAIVEIPLQTTGIDAITVSAPQVIMRSRKPNVTTGVIGILALGGQGSGTVSQYETDLDSAAPVTVPFSPGGGQNSAGGPPQYYYVTNTNPAVLLLAVRDSGCDCTFDVKVSWQTDGHEASEVLTDNGRDFHIVGSAGLPWYTGGVYGTTFTRVTSPTFPADWAH